MKSEDSAPSAGEAQLASLYAAIGGASVLADAPEAVQKAARELTAHIEKELDSPEEGDTLFRRLTKFFTKRDEDLAKARTSRQSEDNSDEDEDGDEDDDVEKQRRRVAPADGDDDLYADVEPDVQKAEFEDVVKAEDFEPVVETVEVLREALAKALERIEDLEDTVTGSAQVYGQEFEVAKSGPTSLQDAIIGAAMGQRVTLS